MAVHVCSPKVATVFFYIGQNCQSWVVLGCAWLCLAVLGCAWLCLAVLGCAWLCLAAQLRDKKLNLTMHALYSHNQISLPPLKFTRDVASNFQVTLVYYCHRKHR